MGWSEGKGLGVNEDGATDFVRVQKKKDNRGTFLSRFLRYASVFRSPFGSNISNVIFCCSFSVPSLPEMCCSAKNPSASFRVGVGIGGENKPAQWANGLREYDSFLTKMQSLQQKLQEQGDEKKSDSDEESDSDSSSSSSESEEKKKSSKKSKKEAEKKKSKKRSRKESSESSSSSSESSSESESSDPKPAKKSKKAEEPVVVDQRRAPKHFMYVCQQQSTSYRFDTKRFSSPGRVSRARNVKNYSAEDMKAILGLKADQDTPSKAQEASKSDDEEDLRPGLGAPGNEAAAASKSEDDLGVFTVTSSTSLADYFKKKQGAIMS